MRNYTAELFDLRLGNNEEQFKRTCEILYKCVYILNHSITQSSYRSNIVQVFKFSIILLPKVALAQKLVICNLQNQRRSISRGVLWAAKTSL